MARKTSVSKARARSRAAPPAPRAWQRMLSGRRLDLLDPSPMDIEIEDIAHGLARVARWNGQTAGEHALSVAQHSVIVEDIAGQLAPELTPAERLMALLHDAPEYVIGDMISPFKAALGLDYRAFEDRLERAVHIRFGLPAKPSTALKRVIKQADHICAYFEAVGLAGFSEMEAEGFFGAPPETMHYRLEALSATDAQRAFLDRFAILLRAHDAQTHADGDSESVASQSDQAPPPDDAPVRASSRT